MDLDTIREYCLSLPHATEDVQWGNDLLFRIAGKIFAAANLDPPHSLSLKCTPEKFADLIEIDGIIPARYMARNKWVTILRFDALPDKEIKLLVRESYDMICGKLPKKVRDTLA
jgi:predicted DNA-binding protein (MmcQ/YjbR family)